MISKHVDDFTEQELRDWIDESFREAIDQSMKMHIDAFKYKISRAKFDMLSLSGLYMFIVFMMLVVHFVGVGAAAIQLGAFFALSSPFYFFLMAMTTQNLYRHKIGLMYAILLEETDPHKDRSNYQIEIPDEKLPVNTEQTQEPG